ncbi:MAG TPA: hypothetical protein VGB53_08700 [Rubricoccaceae bacterium]|jgi:hypothetical protein
MRTYTESEVADIIARAAERQATTARATERGVGLTLDEIERLGADAGLNPDDLRAAAAEVDAAGRTLTRQASQTDTHVVVERWIDAPLTPEAWEDAVDGLREHLGLSAMAAFGGAAGGTVQQVGRAFEWTHTSSLGVQTVVTASPRGERTRLRMSQLVGLASSRTEGIAYGMGVAFVIAAIVLVALTKADVAGLTTLMSTLAAFAASFAVAAPGTTTLDRRWRSRKLASLERLADDIAARLALAEPAPEPEHALEPEHAAPVAAPLRDAFDHLADDIPGTATRDAAAPDRREAPGRMRT